VIGEFAQSCHPSDFGFALHDASIGPAYFITRISSGRMSETPHCIKRV
jgi:hypothetical protein